MKLLMTRDQLLGIELLPDSRICLDIAPTAEAWCVLADATGDLRDELLVLDGVVDEEPAEPPRLKQQCEAAFKVGE